MKSSLLPLTAIQTRDGDHRKTTESAGRSFRTAGSAV